MMSVLRFFCSYVTIAFLAGIYIFCEASVDISASSTNNYDHDHRLLSAAANYSNPSDQYVPGAFPL